MAHNESVDFVFSLTKEIERSFHCPVIFFTEKDYGHHIHRYSMEIHNALQENAESVKLVEIVNAFHSDWLQAVDDIESFRKRLKDTPREVVISAITFTIKCLEKRSQTLYEHVKQMKDSLTHEKKHMMHINFSIIAEIQAINIRSLLEKQKYISSQADQTDYHNQIQDELEELFNWLDKLYDSMSLQLLKLLNLRDPIIPIELSNTLKLLIDEIIENPGLELQKIQEQNKRINLFHKNECSGIHEKMYALENRINQLPARNTTPAQEHKTIYLKDRLQSLENIKQSIIRFKSEYSNNDDDNGRIFLHSLPQPYRARLVELLLNIWNSVLDDHYVKSLISILSVQDFKETYRDVYGSFTVDKYGRKLYSKVNDTEVYQLNEICELVPVRDTDSHIYFYDNCGRYYCNDAEQRVYKSHEGASEYVLNFSGTLVKVKEERDGIHFFYDWLGRYFIGMDGKKIYRDIDSSSDYEDDGLGNLVKIKNNHYGQEITAAATSSVQLTVEDNLYLQQVVGQALKHCIADVVLHKPQDPVGRLADNLEKYRLGVTGRAS